MNFVATELPGVFLIELEPHPDERGFFARSYCEREFAEHGLASRFVQCNISFNHRKGTLRGMHLQIAPHAEAKLVRCTAGAIFDVVADLREDSPTRGRWLGFELSAADRRMLYLPEGIAHGFQTLADASEVFYQMSGFHAPQAARGFRYDDPQFGIAWPAEPRVISERDRALPPWDFATRVGAAR